jgi:hypothetical protein
MIVEVPKIAEHAGYPGNIVRLEISDNCPQCGAMRGKRIWRGLSYDGSRRLNVDCWENECSHVDYYSAVRSEGKPVPFNTPTELQRRSTH